MTITIRTTRSILPMKSTQLTRTLSRCIRCTTIATHTHLDSTEGREILQAAWICKSEGAHAGRAGVAGLGGALVVPCGVVHHIEERNLKGIAQSVGEM